MWALYMYWWYLHICQSNANMYTSQNEKTQSEEYNIGTTLFSVVRVYIVTFIKLQANLVVKGEC